MTPKSVFFSSQVLQFWALWRPTLHCYQQWTYLQYDYFHGLQVNRRHIFIHVPPTSFAFYCFEHLALGKVTQFIKAAQLLQLVELHEDFYPFFCSSSAIDRL